MNNPIISKTVKFELEKMPPEVDFIEEQIKLQGIDPLRWAIVDVENNIVSVSVSGFNYIT